MSKFIKSAPVEATLKFSGANCTEVQIKWKTSSGFTVTPNKAHVVQAISKKFDTTEPYSTGNQELTHNGRYKVSFFALDGDVEVVFSADILTLDGYGISLIKGLLSMDISLENIAQQKNSHYSGSTHDPRH